MINICLYCNPLYDKSRDMVAGTGAAIKDIDMVSQAIILCNSIYKNWHSFEYQISLFYNNNIKWSDYDWQRINKLTFIDLIPLKEGDHPKYPWQNRCACFNYPLGKKGTHRLVLDCDMIALEEPQFDLSCDWQAMFSISGQLPHEVREGYPNYKICSGKCFKKCPKQLKEKVRNFLIQNNIILSESCLKYEDANLQECHLHTEYHRRPDIDYKKFYPHFNFGAILLKEELCNEFSQKFKIGYDLEKINIRVHCALEYSGTYILKSMSDNWKPFHQGFNFLIPCFTAEEVHYFLKNKKISLAHYPGSCSLENFQMKPLEFVDTEYKKLYGESLLSYLE